MTWYEWDETKNRNNLVKHGISFETAILIFDDPGVLSEVERVVDGEVRWHSIGMIGDVLVVLVAHTCVQASETEEVIRVISARKATLSERAKYGEAQ